MKKRIILLLAILLVILVLGVLFFVDRINYTEDERKFSNEYSYVNKNNNVEYINKKQLDEYKKNGTHIILISNPDVESSKILVPLLVDKVIEYNKTISYYNSVKTNDKKTLVIFIKNGKISKQIEVDKKVNKNELENEIDDAIESLSKEVCEIDSKC